GERFAPMATLVNNSDLLHSAMQIVIVGARGECECDAMIRAVYSLSLTNRILSVIAPGTSMPSGHPAAGKTQRDGKATAYLCVGPTCSLPVSNAAALRALVQDAMETGPSAGAQITEQDA
ncbi:MAG: thioredoxin domain-containing protein, partial [Alphaproteobacteria bacterium]